MTIAIDPQPVAGLSERDLARLWEGQRFPAEALTTRHGERLRVIYRGRPGGGAGPDFRDALIEAPYGLLRGDIELHTRSSDFRRHGHHLNPAYNRLALHVVFWHDDPADTLLADGRRAPVVGLADWVRARTEEIHAWLSRPGVWQEPCQDALARLGASRMGETLDALGDVRFRQKADAWRERLREAPAEQLLWEGLLEGLGYGGDREGFRALAGQLPWRPLRARLLEAEARSRAALAKALIASAAGEKLRRERIRHSSGGGGRLEGAARLAGRFAERGPLEALLTPLRESSAAAAPALIQALTAPRAIGRSRAIELLSNAVLPLAAALGDEGLTEAARQAYARLPLPVRYGPVRHLHRAAAGLSPLNARRQQGMLQLLRGWCSQGGCGRCPFSGA